MTYRLSLPRSRRLAPVRAHKARLGYHRIIRSHSRRIRLMLHILCKRASNTLLLKMQLACLLPRRTLCLRFPPACHLLHFHPPVSTHPCLVAYGETLRRPSLTITSTPCLRAQCWYAFQRLACLRRGCRRHCSTLRHLHFIHLPELRYYRSSNPCRCRLQLLFR